MKRVLIITYSFPPLNNIAARRYGEMIDYFPNFGWEPIILTCNSKGELSVDLKNTKILRYGKHPQNSMFINKNEKKGIKSSILKLKRKLGFNLRMFDQTYFKWFKTIKNNDIKIGNLNFDLIVSSYGPSASLFLGKYLSEKYNKPWIADFRDLGAAYQDPYYKRNYLSKRIDFGIEKYLLSNCSGIMSVSKTLTQLIGEMYKLPSYTLYNGWLDIKNIKGGRTDEKYIYYAGRFYPHQLESVYKLLKNLKYYQDIKLKIRSLGPEEMNNSIIEFSEELNLKNQIEILKPSSPEKIYEESQNSLANLVVEDMNKDILWKKGTLTGKFLGLLPLVPPILAIAREDSEIGQILNETQKGELCTHDKEIINFLETLAIKRRPMNIEKYSKKNQAKELSKFFEKILESQKIKTN